MTDHCYVDAQGRRYCDHVHAEDLPANNPEMRGSVSDDYYEHLPGWTAQFQDQYTARQERFHQELREAGVEIIE